MGFLARLFGRRETPPAPSQQPAQIYLDLRMRALRFTPQEAGVGDVGSDQPLAILMETGHPQGVTVTLAGMADGTTSLYFSNGGGIIGGGQHEPVAAATEAWLEQAKQFLPSLSATTQFPLPATGMTRFYVVLADRIVASEEVAENDLGYQRHALSPLFHGGQNVITQVRLHSSR